MHSRVVFFDRASLLCLQLPIVSMPQIVALYGSYTNAKFTDFPEGIVTVLPRWQLVSGR
jgi:hypothetical protein